MRVCTPPFGQPLLIYILYSKMAASQLDMSAKKIYKWGYDRKRVSRSVIKIKTEGAIDQVVTPSDNASSDSFTNPDMVYSCIKRAKASDYNSMVDEIIRLHSKQTNLSSEHISEPFRAQTTTQLGKNQKYVKAAKPTCQVPNLCLNDSTDIFEANEAVGANNRGGDQKNEIGNITGDTTSRHLKMEDDYLKFTFDEPDSPNTANHFFNELSHPLDYDFTSLSPNYGDQFENGIFSKSMPDLENLHNEYF